MAKILPFQPIAEVSGSEDRFVRIVVRDMEVDVQIGLYDSEKNRRQRIKVTVALYANAATYLRAANKDNIIDYSLVINNVREWAQRPHTFLVESYVRELLDLCFSMSGVEACGICILKPEVCPESQGAGVEVFMRREDWSKG